MMRYFVSFLLLAFSGFPVFASGGVIPGLVQIKSNTKGIKGFYRKYSVYTPTYHDPKRSWPVVIALHGGLSKAKNIRLRSGLDAIAEREGFIALYPQGDGVLRFLRHWNAGTCCGKAAKENVDDAAYVMQLVDGLSQTHSVDARRVYAFGFSNGGMLAYQLAARFPDRIAAIAPVSATFGRVSATGDFDWGVRPPGLPVPTLIIHGDSDPRLPFDGIVPADSRRGGNGMVPVLDSARWWALNNGCGDTMNTLSSGYANVEQYEWTGCDSDATVRVYKLGRWKHAWAGRSPKTRNDHSRVGGFEAGEVIWTFFDQHNR